MPGVVVTLPNIIDARAKLPTIIEVGKGDPTVVLPAVTLPSIALLNTNGLPPILNLPAGGNLLLINLPGISIVGPNLPALANAGNGILGVLLNQVAGVNQLLANTTALNLLGPIGQVVDSLIAGEGPAANASSEDNSNGPVALVSLPLTNVWMWSAVTFASGSHGGFDYKATFAGDTVSGSTLPSQSSGWTVMPGMLVDISSPLGLQRGTVHIGVSGGASWSDLDIRGDSLLRDLGIARAGSARQRSWSLGGFALLTKRPWYAGAATGGTWGEAETENTVTGAESTFGGSSLTSSLFAGTIVTITQTTRVDLRGTLGYHRTQGDAHRDSIGIRYGEHVIEHLDGTLSARLLATVPIGASTLRPFVQAGLTHRFTYSNELQVQGVDFSFDDADTSIFVAGGVDLDMSDRLQISAGLRRDSTADYDYLSGRLGILLKLN